MEVKIKFELKILTNLKNIVPVKLILIRIGNSF